MSEKVLCQHCGAAMMEHRETLSRGLVGGLIRLVDQGTGPFNLRVLNFTRSQWQNFSKLSYWGFVQKAGEQQKGGRWEITTEGLDFLCGASAPKVLWTYRGTPVRYEETRVTIRELLPGYHCRQEYAASARAHEEGALFER